MPFIQKIFHKRSAATPLLLGFLAVLVVLCLFMDSLELTYGLRTDLSFNELTTPSATTQEVLAEISVPVHIYAIFQKGNEDVRLFEVLNRYQALSGQVTWEQTDLALNPGLVARFQGTDGTNVNQESVIVYCETTDRYRVLQSTDFVSVGFDADLGSFQMGFSYEKKLSEALLYVTRDEVYQIAILQGHNELDKDALGFLTAYLSSNNYDVSFVNLLAGDTLPQGALLMMLSPVRDLQPAELELLLEFASDGGAVFMTLDPSDPIENMPNYQTLLRLYGFEPLAGVAVAAEDEKGTYYDVLPYVLIPNMELTAITTPLVASAQEELWLSMPRAFKMPDGADNALTLEPVLTTTSGAYLADLGRMPLKERDGDLTGPFALALLASRLMESTHLSRAFIIGNSTLLTEPDLYAYTDTGPFILKTVQHLLDQSVLSLSIEQKPAIRPALSPAARTPGMLLIFLVPLVVLCAALAVLLPRRHK